MHKTKSEEGHNGLVFIFYSLGSLELGRTEFAITGRRNFLRCVKENIGSTDFKKLMEEVSDISFIWLLCIQCFYLFYRLKRSYKIIKAAHHAELNS